MADAAAQPPGELTRPPQPFTPEDIVHRFAYHRPANETIARLHERVREITGHAAQELHAMLPPGREASLASTHLEHAMMWANAAVARDQAQAQARAEDRGEAQQ